MSKYMDDSTRASDPGGITTSDDMLKRFHPEIYTTWARLLGSLPEVFPIYLLPRSSRWRDVIDEHMRFGDSRAALVMSVEPLLVAAYTDELDCVVLLRFDSWVTDHHELQVGDRLLTVNTYAAPSQVKPAQDLIFGPAQFGQWVDYWPIIADFITEDSALVEARKAKIPEDEWERAHRMAERLMESPKALPREGAPLSSQRAADMLKRT